MSNRATNPLDFLVQFLSTFEDGRIFLSHGRYEYKFATRKRPTLVWIAEVDSGNVPVCHGSVNTFGVELLDDGFVLIADVQAENTEILWQAFLDTE
jgi:hypothetical protein